MEISWRVLVQNWRFWRFRWCFRIKVELQLNNNLVLYHVCIRTEWTSLKLIIFLMFFNFIWTITSWVIKATDVSTYNQIVWFSSGDKKKTKVEMFDSLLSLWIIFSKLYNWDQRTFVFRVKKITCLCRERVGPALWWKGKDLLLRKTKQLQ